MKYFFYKKTKKTTKSEKTTRKKKMATQQEIELAIEELATKCLENGLIIEDIPMSLRTENICINALKWGLKIYKTNPVVEPVIETVNEPVVEPVIETETNAYNEQREICFRIMNSFPKEILLTGFVVGHLSQFA